MKLLTSAPVDEVELKAALRDVFPAERGESSEFVALVRDTSPYASSFPIEELELTLGEGETIDLIFKNCGKPSTPESAAFVKPEFLFDPRREILVYAHCLSRMVSGPPRYFGCRLNGRQDQFWLFIEHVPGVELYQVGDFDVWRDTARWLARFHRKLSGQAAQLSSRVPLIVYNQEFLARWPIRVEAFSKPGSSTRSTRLEQLVQRYGRVIDRLCSLPQTLLHGDFNSSNIIVRNEEHPCKICPIDWDMSGIGPGLLDLAALVSGSWTNSERMALTDVYLDTLEEPRWQGEGRNQAYLDLDYCRLHLAMQWLGWSKDWRPPPEHRQDWYSLALELSERLQL